MPKKSRFKPDSRVVHGVVQVLEINNMCANTANTGDPDLDSTLDILLRIQQLNGCSQLKGTSEV